MLDFLPDAVRTLLAFVLVLGVLVFFHELGHYLAARWRRVHVDAFSIGFGRPILSWRDRRGTDWRISWIPLGGYVKLHGQGPEAETPEAERVPQRPARPFTTSRCGTAPSWSRPGRWRTSCWRSCSSRGST
jgi:regulator of sigma E protease